MKQQNLFIILRCILLAKYKNSTQRNYATLMKYTLEENQNSNTIDELFNQYLEKLPVIRSMIKMTRDFLQLEQFTRSFN